MLELHVSLSQHEEGGSHLLSLAALPSLLCLFVLITGYSLLQAPPREWIFACMAVCTPASRAVILRLRGVPYSKDSWYPFTAAWNWGLVFYSFKLLQPAVPTVTPLRNWNLYTSLIPREKCCPPKKLIACERQEVDYEEEEPIAQGWEKCKTKRLD